MPGANQKDDEVFRKLGADLKASGKIAAFCMSRRKGIAAEDDPLLQVSFCPGSSFRICILMSL